MIIDARPSSPFAAEPRVGQAWAYRARGHEPLVQVVVLKIGVKRPARVLVRFVDEEFEGQEDWVPPARLKAPWHDVDAFRTWEWRWDAIVAASPERDSAEESAASVVFDLMIDPVVAALGYNASQGVVKIRDRGRLAADLDIGEGELKVDPLSFEEDGCLVAPWPITRSIAATAAARNPEAVTRYIAKEEADARREASFGRYTRPISRFDDGFISPEVCAEIDDEHGRPVRAVLRAWCGEQAVTLSDEVNQLRHELRRVAAIAERSAAALREHNAARDAGRIERELGISPAPRQTRPSRRRPPRERASADS